MKKKVLNVGGRDSNIPIPNFFSDWDKLILDIDPETKADIICDAKLLKDKLDKNIFDAVYCSHTLEHFYRHETLKVIKGFHHIVKEDGFVQVLVPDIENLIKLIAYKNIPLDKTLYMSPSGEVNALDIIYGSARLIVKNGDFLAHKNGFSPQIIKRLFLNSGFKTIFIKKKAIEIILIAFKGKVTDYYYNLLDLQEYQS